MAAIITNDYRVFNVDTFLKSMEGSTPDIYTYLFLGDSMRWDLTNPLESTSDSTPATPIDNTNSKNFIWENMMFLKRILRSEVSHGIKKTVWTSGNYYDIYRSDYGNNGVQGISLTGQVTYPISLDVANYYVVTSNGNVYICLGNNSGLTASTSNPQDYGVGVGFGSFTTADGYIWKFISSISSADSVRFSTINFHPVKQVTTQPVSGDPYELQYLAQEAAVEQAGAIYNVIVTAPGTNDAAYSGTIGTLVDQSFFNIKGDGSGLKISATFGGLNNLLQKITILAPGTGYSYCSITITGVTGSNLTPIYTPLTGLGANPIYDLGSNYLLVGTKIEGSNSADYIVNNDFRQIGLITNPLTSSGSLANADTLDASYRLTVTNTGLSFTVDTEIVDNTTGSRARVIDWNAATKVLKVNLSRPLSTSNWSAFNGFNIGDTISVVGGSISNEPLANVVVPEIAHNTGKIIYFENRIPIIRNALQIEDIHLVLEY